MDVDELDADDQLAAVLAAALVAVFTTVHVGREAVDRWVEAAFDSFVGRGVDTASPVEAVPDAQVVAARRKAWWTGTAVPSLRVRGLPRPMCTNLPTMRFCRMGSHSRAVEAQGKAAGHIARSAPARSRPGPDGQDRGPRPRFRLEWPGRWPTRPRGA